MVDPTHSLSNNVYESLRSAIKDGRYARGSRLRERDIADELGVSRTPVREALLKLVARGLLQAAAGGLVVRELSRREVFELYASREVLEGGAAGFAACYASDWTIANLRLLHKSFAEAGSDRSKIMRTNRAVHVAIFDSAQNDRLASLNSELTDAFALLPSTTFEVEGRFELAIAEHEAIIEAIARHSQADAEQAARLHIRNAMEARLRMI